MKRLLHMTKKERIQIKSNKHFQQFSSVDETKFSNFKNTKNGKNCNLLNDFDIQLYKKYMQKIVKIVRY